MLHFFVHRYGIVFRASPRQADVIIVAGTLTNKVNKLSELWKSTKSVEIWSLSLMTFLFPDGPGLQKSLRSDARATLGGQCHFDWIIYDDREATYG